MGDGHRDIALRLGTGFAAFIERYLETVVESVKLTGFDCRNLLLT